MNSGGEQDDVDRLAPAARSCGRRRAVWTRLAHYRNARTASAGAGHHRTLACASSSSAASNAHAASRLHAGRYDSAGG